MGNESLEKLAILPIKSVEASRIDFPQDLSRFNALVPDKDKVTELYFKGTNLLNPNQLRIAVVGTQAINHDIQRATILTVDSILKTDDQAAIVSGLAKGTDTVALDSVNTLNSNFGYSGRQIAILPSPISQIFPEQNIGLALDVATKGQLVSEFASSQSDSRLESKDFLRRNRIVAAVSSAVVIVAGDFRSGTYSTANWAHKIGKPIICIRINNQASGVEQRLRQENKTANLISVSGQNELLNALSKL